jgi:hypothetical protein
VAVGSDGLPAGSNSDLTWRGSLADGSPARHGATPRRDADPAGASEGVSQRVLGELIGLKPLTSLLRWLAAAQGITEQNLPGAGHRCPAQYASRLRPAWLT